MSAQSDLRAQLATAVARQKAAEADLAAALAEAPHLAPALAALAATRSGEFHANAADWQALAVGAERIAPSARAVTPLPTAPAEALDASIDAGFADLDRLASGVDDECPV